MADAPTAATSSRPGRWVRACHKTRWGVYEIRKGLDGTYDVREPLTKDHTTVRGVDPAYVRAEFIPNCKCEYSTTKSGMKT